MIISHNLMAMNAQRQLGINTNNRLKTSEKLSSGYKINRASDDAAGLSISEKMRKQIRGLERGADNINDGISMVQVADGALDEVTACLQRMNELTIQAYNGINSREDREYIQNEIDEIISEIGRIADATKFNELYVLKGNPKTEVIIDTENPIQGFMYQYQETTIPDWLSVSPKLEGGRNVAVDSLDTTSNVVLQTSPGVYEYYGAQNAELDQLYGSASYKGQWSSDIQKKASAIIDFSGLTNTTDAVTLYKNLYDLLGSSIGVPCGTCTNYYGISFTGNEQGLEISDGGTKFATGSAESVSYLNLSEWKPWENAQNNPSNETIFEKVKALVKDHATDTAKDATQKANETKALAEQIAKALRDETLERITQTVGGGEHFNRAAKISGDDYSLMIYDVRDTDKLATQESADTLVQTSAKAYTKIPYSMLGEGAVIEVENPLMIQCSSEADDTLPVDLPLLDITSLGISSYSISSYEEIERYSEKYLNEIENWKKTGGCTYEYVTKTIPAQDSREEERYVAVRDVDSNGEIKTKYVKQKVTIPGTPERTVTERVLKEVTPKPQLGPNDYHVDAIYKPSDVKVIEDAIVYVGKCRAKLGAAQNRLEHAYATNMNTGENTTAAESRMRDADMAEEMIGFSKNNILVQAAQSILAQANSTTLGILSLL